MTTPPQLATAAPAVAARFRPPWRRSRWTGRCDAAAPARPAAATPRRAACRWPACVEPMRTHPRQARAATRLSHDAADRCRREPPIRLAHRSEHRLRLAVGPAIGQICHDRFPDIAGHREPIDPVALAPHRDLTGTPIEVAEPQVGGLGAA